MGVGGAVGLSTAANIFVGHVEAPLFIRPYLARLSRGELFVVMTGGMASIAGTVLVLYAQFLGPIIKDAAGHLIIASVLSAPVAVLIGQIMIPLADVPMLGATDDADLALQILVRQRVEQLPVVEHGMVLGFVHRWDILRWLVRHDVPA